MLIGADLGLGPERTHLYRALDHGPARIACRDLLKSATSKHGGDFARSFLQLQLDRLRADYDPSSDITYAQALDSIEAARNSIRALASMTAEEQRRLLVQVLFSRSRR